MDRLSELHDSLIHHILSYLPLQDVIRTTLLSKRWNNLWTTVTCLQIDPNVTHDEDNARDFIRRALLTWNGTKIIKFVIYFWQHFETESFITLECDMDFWIGFAVDNKVEDLIIDLFYENQRHQGILYSVPQCLYSCSSIKKLSLSGVNLHIHQPPSWNQLKSLKIGCYCVSECTINSILSGSPLLEEFELRVYESIESLNIYSASLKKLTIQSFLCASWYTMLKLTICCVNLQNLEIFGALYSMYSFEEASSLTDVTLDFHEYNDVRCYESELLKQTLGQVFSTFLCVRRLELSDWCFQVFGGSQKAYSISQLPNVKILKLNVYKNFKLVDMMYLLQIFPYLQKLVIKHYNFSKPKEFDAENLSEFETILSKAFSRLKTINIDSDLSDSLMLQCIELLLEHASALEKLVIRDAIYTKRKFDNNIEEKLFSMPRSSPIVKVVLE